MTATEHCLLVIEAGERGAELLAQVGAPAARAGLAVRYLPEAGGFEAWNAPDAEVAAVLVGPHSERPVGLARQAHRAVPAAQILFLAGPERAALLQRQMSTAPMVGQYRIVPEVADALDRALDGAARTCRQRRQTRTALDRINLGLAARSPIDLPDLRQLVVSDRLFATVLQQAPDAILPLDEAGHLLSLNRAAEALFGTTEAAAVGSPVWDLAGEENVPGLAALVEAVRSGAPAADRQISYPREDGASLAIEVQVVPVRDELGRRMGFLAMARDVTQRQQAEAERSAKDEFVATMSHELRTPLNAMLGWARLLRTGKLDEATIERAVGTIERNAVNQARLIDDLLDVSRIITGKLRLNVQPVDPAAVIEAAVDSVRPAAQAKNVRLQIILDSGLGSILGDSQRLQQIVWNLVANAVKFTPKNGRVRIALERINSHVEINVEDTGQGISPDFLPFVFDRFRQADGTSTRMHGGLGLGLAIVRHLTELHGGSVVVHSEGEGRGALFSVRLPLMATRGDMGDRTAHERVHSAAGEPAPFEPSQSLDGLRLLVVDDEPDTLEVLGFLLGREGAEVRVAASAQGALAELRDWQPDLLLSDIGMPGEDGYALLEKARALEASRARWLPAIALTAYARPEDRVRLLSAGFQAHLPKPVDPAELIAAILSQARSLR